MIIWLLCGLAAVHVIVFSAAFPFFNNVDEQFHLDLTVKYALGRPPAGWELVSPATARYLSLYGSHEFLWSPTNFPGGQFPPPLGALPDGMAASLLVSREAAWSESRNSELSQPPLYYAVTGAAWRLLEWRGAEVYDLRFLNAFWVAALVWLGYAAAGLVFPEREFVRLGVPALLAFMPQTAFYSINNDVLSPVCFGGAFILIIKFLRAEAPRPALGAGVGLALAAAYLTKLSNLPLLAVSAAAMLLKTFRLAKGKRLRPALPSLITLLFCAWLPTAAWMAWCKHAFGDWTGSAEKIRLLGWTLKPFGEWWAHPIFTPHGAWTFGSGLLATFWQGEFLWHREPLAWPIANLVYVLATLGSLALVLAGRFGQTTEPQRQALRFALTGFLASAGGLALLSVMYDFGNCFYPSRAHPYFTSGRLALGALVPFMLLFVFGMDRALGRLGTRAKFLVLAGMILLMLASETATDWPVFSSSYNWFHLEVAQ